MSISSLDHNVVFLYATLVGILLGLAAIKLIDLIDGCYVLSRCNGHCYAKIACIKNKADISSLLNQIGAGEQTTFNYFIEHTYGRLAYKKNKTMPKLRHELIKEKS